MRLFVAVAIEPALAAAIEHVAADLRHRIEMRAPRARLTWVPPERLHFTLRFIGDVDAAIVDGVRAVLAIPLATPAFELGVGGLGAFPERGTPRVLWVGVDEGRDAMLALEREVSGRLADLGFEADATYRPHLTLARVRDAMGLRARDVLEGAAPDPIGSTRIDAITLFESRSSPKGPSYVPVQRTALGGPEGPPLRS